MMVPALMVGGSAREQGSVLFLCGWLVVISTHCTPGTSNPWRRGQPRDVRPLNIAHRGFSAVAPENTLEAAQRAFESGADLWELDVHLSRDGHLVVIHDDDLRRTTNVHSQFPDDPRQRTGYRVRDFDLDELRTLDAGSWFVQDEAGATVRGTRISDADRRWYASGKTRIPTLREALIFTRNRNWAVNVEIKNIPVFYEGIAEKTIALVRELGMTGSVLISSFDHEVIRRTSQLEPEIAAAALAGQRIGRPGAYLAQILDADVYHPSAVALGARSAAYVDAPAVERLFTPDVMEAHAHGVRVNVWTVNDFAPEGLAAHLLVLGVDGLITDYPDRLEAVLDERFGPDLERDGVGQPVAFSALPELAQQTRD